MTFRALPQRCALPGCGLASVRPHRIRRHRVCAAAGNGGERQGEAGASSSWREYDDACEVRTMPLSFRDVMAKRTQRRRTSGPDDNSQNPNPV